MKPPPPTDRLASFASALGARARARGRKARLSPEEVEAVATRVALLDLAAEEMGLYGKVPGPGREKRASGLTAEEAKLLSGGLGKRLPGVPRDFDPWAAGRAHLARLRADSMSVEEAAKLLDVNPSRIRQRLGGKPRTLLGMKVGRSWRVLRYQLDGDRLVPNLEKVIAAMPRGHDPAGEHNWLTLPEADLEIDDEAVSPLSWLKTGLDPAPVVEIARYLDMGM